MAWGWGRGWYGYTRTYARTYTYTSLSSVTHSHSLPALLLPCPLPLLSLYHTHPPMDLLSVIHLSVFSLSFLVFSLLTFISSLSSLLLLPPYGNLLITHSCSECARQVCGELTSSLSRPKSGRWDVADTT
jgi:hypothetical protein